MPTDVAGGVTDAELDELYYAVIRAYCVPADKSKAMRGRREVLRRFALEQQARGVDRAAWQFEARGLDEEAARLRALAERLRKGQL